MKPSETTDWAAEAQRQLDMAHDQLVRYARDLKCLLDAERRKTQELAEAHARLQILHRLKSDFLIFIAHELRTPRGVSGCFQGMTARPGFHCRRPVAER
jgi:signal transduction histidine kinase